MQDLPIKRRDLLKLSAAGLISSVSVPWFENLASAAIERRSRHGPLRGRVAIRERGPVPLGGVRRDCLHSCCEEPGITRDWLPKRAGERSEEARRVGTRLEGLRYAPIF